MLNIRVEQLSLLNH